jgi:hypothetical protein
MVEQPLKAKIDAHGRENRDIANSRENRENRDIEAGKTGT